MNDGDIIAKIKVIPEESQLSSAESRVALSKISLEKARLAYERTKALYEKKYESREKYEADFAAYENARQELAQAQDQLTIVRDGVSAANAQGSNTLVRSTVTGVVLEVPVKVGSSVIQANTFNDGTTIAKVADMTDLIFKGKIDETEVDMLREGMSVRISVGAIAGSDYPATIEKIAPMATDDNGTNTFEVKAALSAGRTRQPACRLQRQCHRDSRKGRKRDDRIGKCGGICRRQRICLCADRYRGQAEIRPQAYTHRYIRRYQGRSEGFGTLYRHSIARQLY